MPDFPSDPWFKDLVGRINGSPEYRDAAATWEGDIAFAIEAEPDRGLTEDAWGYLDLWHGECRSGGLIDAERGASARYIIRAPYSRWKDVLRGDLEPVKAMMQGKLNVQGDLPTIIRYVKAASVLVELTGTVETRFPDEP